MKFILIAAFTLVASAMAENATIVLLPSGMGGTAASASIVVNNPNASKSAGTQLNSGMIAIAVTSAATAAYALL